MSGGAGQLQVRVREAFQSMYPDLAPGQWYPVASRAGDDTRPQGASSSGGGPTPSAGVCVSVSGTERFLFRHYVEFRNASAEGPDTLD